MKSALEGFNCTVFAYGQTGTGKTFTMEGGLEGGAAWSADHADSGMIARAVRDVFSSLEHNMDAENSVRVSHMELFNEELIDLLGSSEEKPLRLFEHPKEGVTIHNLEQVPVTSADAIFKILRRSATRRHEAATKMNASSSRSHCIFTITVQTKEATGDGGELIRIGRLNLIDLAGSENVAKSGTASGEVKREAGVINQSLLVLGRVLTSLSENRPHVPYRESKLTRIMADAVGGKHKTTMIACITQAASSYDETLATLEYANAAKKIKNKPEQNAKITKKAVIKEYLHEIERLKMQVTAAREKNGVYLSPEEFKQMQDQLKASQDSVVRLESQLTTKSKQLDDITSMFSTTSDKLRETTEVLKATDNELVETKAALAETQSTLEHTQDTLEENAEIIRHRQQTEKVLHANASAILKTLDVRENDVEGLHAKISRKSAMEEENRAISQSFRKYVGGKVEDMSSQLKRFRSAQSDQFSQVKSTVHKFMEDKAADMDKLCEKLDKLQEMLQNTQAKVGSIVSTHAEETGADLLAIQQAAATGRAKVTDSLQQFVAASGAQIEQWRVQLNEQRNEVTDWGVNTAALIQSAIETNDEWSSAHSGDLEALKALLDQNTKASLMWADEHKRSLDTSIKAYKERMEKQQREMFRQVSDFVSNFVIAQQKSLATSIGQLQESNNVHARALAAQTEARSKVIDQSIVPSVDARNKKLQSEFSVLSETVSTQSAADNRRIAKDQGRSDKWTSNADSFFNTMSTQSEACEKRLESDLDDMYEKISTAEIDHKTKYEEVVSATGTWRDESTEFEMVLRSSIEETQMAVEAKIKGLETHIGSFGDKLQSEISGVQDQFFHYFDSLREDVSTGQTPQRRAVPHPKNLPRSLPDEEILQEFEAAKRDGKAPTFTSNSLPDVRLSLQTAAAPLEFPDFALDESKGVESTPVQQQTQRPASLTASKSQTDKKQRPEAVAPASTSAIDKKAAVKAQRQQAQLVSSSSVKGAKSTSAPNAANRAALAPVSANSRLQQAK